MTFHRHKDMTALGHPPMTTQSLLKPVQEHVETRHRC